jgi:protein involved in polysaccharide export with SLBB domain
MNYFKIFIIFSLIFNINFSYSQNVDSEFIESLPEDIKDDFIKNLKNKNGFSEPVDQKDYNAFQSIVPRNNNEESSYRKLERFGNRFFTNTPSTFMPINDPSANSGYILDVDDEVLIQFIGEMSGISSYKINRSGEIPVPDVGMVGIAGLSIETANKHVNKILENNFVDTEAIISIEKVRDIEVLITGQVNNPGIYVLSGYSNILHALIMAGGVTEYGSLREVTIKRLNQQNKVVDIYDILVEGKIEPNISLRSGDSIFIKSSRKFIPVMGGVASEAVYEFIDGQTVEDVINIAGGITKEASYQKIIISRENEGVINSREANKSDVIKEGDRLFVPYNTFHADYMMINDIDQFIDTPVEILGAIKKPGKYYLGADDKVSDLIEKAGGYTDNAYPFGGILINQDAKTKEAKYNKRLYDEAIKSLASISQGSKGIDVSNILPILSEFKNTEASGRVVAEFDTFQLSQNPQKNLVLTKGDKIFIPYKNNVVHVFGEVLNPSTVAYNAGYNIKNYIDASGGLNSSADKRRIILVQANGNAKKMKLSNNVFISNEAKILPGSVIYVSRDMQEIQGLDLAVAIAPILSSLAISAASINSISKN